jgi:hypothetical protein
MTREDRVTYARAVWEAWRKKRGPEGPSMSSAEFHLIARLMDADVPLRIVLRGIEDTAGRVMSRTPLSYAGPAIEEAVRRWRSVL